MGKEWLYWGGGGNGKSTKKQRSAGRKGGDERERVTNTPPGCMSAVFQLFDFHHFQFPFHHHTSLKTHIHLQAQPSTLLKGVEAPRNSLELEETCTKAAAASMSSLVIKDEEKLTIPMGIKIKTGYEKRSPTRASSSKLAKFGDHHHQDLISECSSPKTPNLVARLMGLDLLPDSPSPSPFSYSRLSTSTTPQIHPQIRRRPCTGGSVSLPETPRTSSSAIISSRKSDVQVLQHRLSLQINKDNIGEELDENTSPPGHYDARNIAKQIKESVSRRVGLGDITNTIKNRSDKIRRDDNLLRIKPNKLPSPKTTPSCRILDPKNKSINNKTPRVLSSSSPISSELNQSQAVLQQESNVFGKTTGTGRDIKSTRVLSEVQKCKKTRERPASDAIRNKREEPFIRSTTTNKATNNISDNKFKRLSTPLSNDLILPLRKDSSLHLTMLRGKQWRQKIMQSQTSDALWWESRSSTPQISSCSSPSYYSQEKVTYTADPTLREKNIQEKYIRNNGTAVVPSSSTSTTTVDHEIPIRYIKRILKRTGIDNSTPVSLGKWFSHSHPLDPSIFHYIELFHPAAAGVSHRSNRKLIFQLVNELLVEILKNPKPWINTTPSQNMYGLDLIEELCRKIKSFPLANCQVLEDIDALICTENCGEMGKSLKEYEEVGEKIASEIEREIIERMVNETAETLAFCGDAGAYRQCEEQNLTEVTW